MNALLVKEKEHFFLKVKDANGNTMIVANTFEPIIQLANFGGLSMKNCKAIERGYDLEELAQEEYCSSSNPDFDFDSYIKGFQKALELMSDKTFSDADVRKALWLRDDFVQEDMSDDEIIKSLQQNEWEVVIVTEPMSIDEIREQGKGFLNANTQKPKLDSNGKLILKRI